MEEFSGLGVVRLPLLMPEPILQWLLPPDHRIAGVRPPFCDLFYGLVRDYLIEGPLMPPLLEDGEPDEVVLMRDILPQEDGSVRLICGFAHVPEESWLVGEWPTIRSLTEHMCKVRGSAV